MTTPNRPAKRRRLDSALHKPFKSPFRTPLADKTNTSTSLKTPQSEASKPSIAAGSTPRNNTSARVIRKPVQTLGRAPQNPITTTTKPSTIHRNPITTTTLPPSTHVDSPRALEAAILSTRRDNEQLRQALSLLASTTDADLRRLTVRWRSAARQAAEHVYSTMRERVASMGGMQGLREREREMREMRSDWEADDRRAERDKDRREMARLVHQGVVSEEDVEGWEAMRDDNGAESEEQDGEREGDEEVDGEGYTLGTMLESMNIDLEVIGYCAEKQTWQD